MSMNDHEVVGRLLKMTTWSLLLRCILRQIRKRLREFSIFKQLHNKFLDSYESNGTNRWSK